MSDSNSNSQPSEIQLWGFEGHDVRIKDREGNAWFVAGDVCDAWGIKNVSHAVARLDEDEKATITISDSGGRPSKLLLISESGVYALAATSRKESPKRFCKWVRSEVVPTLRKTGTYTMPGAVPPPPPLDPIAFGTAIATAMQPVLLALANGQAEVKTKVDDQAKQLEEQARRIAELEKTAPKPGYMTLAGFEKFKGIKVTDEERKQWGGRLKSNCKRRGIETIPVEDSRWGHVNSYPIWVIQETFDTLGPNS